MHVDDCSWSSSDDFKVRHSVVFEVNNYEYIYIYIYILLVMLYTKRV